jgi:hypothetical protein
MKRFIASWIHTLRGILLVPSEVKVRVRDRF